MHVSLPQPPLGSDPGLQRPRAYGALGFGTRPQDTRLDNYVNRYAARTHGMTASAIRALFAVANRPEVVSLAGGMPNITDLPLDVVGSSLNELVLSNGRQAMQYGSGQGEPVIREAICEVMKLEGISAHPDDVTVTVGSQQGLDLVTRIFCDPGDVVLVEAPSYVGALGVFRAYQCDVVHVAMDEHGLLPDALAEAITALSAAGRTVKFLYTIPNFHNPAGVSQTLERRMEILRVAEQADLLVVEDNPYGLLGFDGDPVPAMRSLEEERVVYLGSFSKTFAPGFRVGWVLAPHAVREKLVLAQESATLCPPVFSQFAVAAYLHHHDWRGQIKVFREMYRERRDAMIAGLTDHMPAGNHLDLPARRVLRLGHAAAWAGFAGHAGAGRNGPGRVRPRHRVLCRRVRQPAYAAVLLFPHSGPDHRGHPATGRGTDLRDRGAGNLRSGHADRGRSTSPPR